MILPAAVVKILGFINLKDKSLNEEPQEGNYLLVKVTSGKKIVLKLTGNKNVTTEDVRIYFENKARSVIKQKEIDLVASELEYIDEIADELDEKLDELKESAKNDGQKLDRKAQNEFKKRFKQEKASEIVYERRRLKPGSIIRVAVSYSNDMKKMEINGEKLNIMVSRCIIFDKEGEPSTTGMYYFSQTANQLPVSISPIFNREKEAIGLFTLTLSELATFDHFELLVGHILRTFDKTFEKSNSIYSTRISYNYNDGKELFKVIKDIKDKDVMQVIKDINEISKTKEIKDVEVIEKLKGLYQELLEIVSDDKELVEFINIQLNLLLTPDLLKSGEDSPFKNLRNSLVNLNFSKYDPDDKSELKKYVQSELDLMMMGGKKMIITGVYNTPALQISEEPDSWGFMHDNVQTQSFVLDSRSTAIILKDCENK